MLLFKNSLTLVRSSTLREKIATWRDSEKEIGSVRERAYERDSKDERKSEIMREKMVQMHEH